jgi:hypothetical protein
MKTILQRLCTCAGTARLHWHSIRLKGLATLLVFVMEGMSGLAQTSGTGAIAGTLTDPSGATLVGAQVKVTSAATGEARTVLSGATGYFYVGLLSPGQYNVEVSSAGFKTANSPRVTVIVGSTTRLDVRLQIGQVAEKITVQAAAEQIQTESSALGHVTSDEQVQNLPLATRNDTQIIALNPNVQSDVWNSSALGNGGSVTGTSSFLVANGSTVWDNNYQMNGVGVNDIGSYGFGGGGAPLPNPDTIQEFKVQTGQYDASYGRNAGANVDVITKGGTNEFHGGAWEFFRNSVLNANTFFRNASGQPRPVLQQNQFGFDLGGPIQKNKLLFFVSYEGNRQRNGLDPQCSSTVTEPAITNDRSARALGALFAGKSGANGGAAILADGSNISPVALNLLNFKLPNGQYMIPSPQTVNSSLPFDSQGRSAFSIACPFTDNQFMTNADYQLSERSKLAGRFFFSDNSSSYTLPFTSTSGRSVPGFPQTFPFGYRYFSLTHTYVFGSNLVNQAEIAFHRAAQYSTVGEPFLFSDVGVTVPGYDNNRPEYALDFPSPSGLELGGNGQAVSIRQNTYTFQDSISWIRGRHRLRFGGAVIREQSNNVGYKFIGGLGYLSWADFLLGQSAAQNGTAFSNVFLSEDSPGLFDRGFRAWTTSAYAQDDIQLTKRLTVNLGLRYDRLGCIADALGRNSTINPALIDRNPPPGGTVDGTQVPSNYTGPVPPGVTRASNECAMNGDGQNTWNPRIGFAWQFPQTDRLVVRGGYGVYHSRYTAQFNVNLLGNPPFSVFRSLAATSNAAATNQVPFALSVPTLPTFIPYSPTTSNFVSLFDPNFRPPMEQDYSLGLQAQMTPSAVLEVGYSGSRGLHQVYNRSLNQAEIASAANPIRGQTTNTLANLPLRVPYEGWNPAGLFELQSEGATWYNALLVSLTKRFSHGLQAQLSYTFSKELVDAYQFATGFGGGGTVLGNQNNPHQSYGPEFYVRPHRFVANYTYELPGPQNRTSFEGQLLGGWALSGVVTMQAGHFLTVTYGNGNSVYGIFSDRASLSGTCRPNQYVHSGGVSSHLTDYINASCFSAPAVFSSDDPNALGFGNAGVGILEGPGQNDWDMAILKKFPVRWPREGAFIEFRSEFFNAFNHTQFADPDSNYGDPTFGQITSTSVNSRIIQFALKLMF